ncbi:MAG: ribokinase [Anaerolineae bacterium]|nr:ribokinase [Anaerolineae bacterium]
MSDILVIGSLNMDLVVRAARMPARGETLPGTDFHTIPGGKGANQAAAAARLGGQVAMLGCVGADAFGEQLVANLASFGVDTSLVRRAAGASSGVAVILVDAAGDNRILVVAGANGQVSEENIRIAGEDIQHARLVVMQLEIPLASVAASARLARDCGTPVLLNPAPAHTLPEGLLALVDTLVVNESEAAALSGLPVTGVVEGFAAAGALRGQGARQVVLTLGEQGALVSAAEGQVHLSGFPVEVVDTTAAGDAFIGGLAVALLEGMPLVEAARFANAAGALACTRLGAQTSLPARHEVMALLG